MKNSIYILLLSFFTTTSFSQTKKESFWNPYIESDRVGVDLKQYDSLIFKKAYRIWTDYQVVELIEVNDSVYSGSLTNFVTQKKSKNKKQIVFQRIKVPDGIVKKLIETLYSQNIEILKDCSEIEKYPKGVDGKTYVFEIGKEKTRRVYSYWEPENESYQDPEMPEIKNVRNIIASINSEFNLWDYFVKFRDRLPSGNYSYGMINMYKI